MIAQRNPNTYQTRPIKRRYRATRIEVEQRRNALLEIVKGIYPASVRQVYYQATVHDLVEKTEAGYGKVQTDLVLLRRAGVIPYGWISDNTRVQRRIRSFDGISDALRETARLYRKSLWADAETAVEIWLEKDALSGVLWPVTSLYDVPLMVARGYASLSFLHSAAEAILDHGRPTFIYHLGDFDPSGVDAGEKIEKTLREMAPSAEIHFKRLAVTPEQITKWRLPTRPTKASDSRAKGFGPVSVELDAIEPHTLRGIVEDAINQHLPQDRLHVLRIAEESERAHFQYLIENLEATE